ncbi:hypothetical protein [Propionivibrio limicola]|uniref:hypothetical protein n=1 Tax=Propionivibrio limicola TaxID=167645 RepID=UPI0014791DB7|nr:hypothetical protein [Propionivibrio limicola]
MENQIAADCPNTCALKRSECLRWHLAGVVIVDQTRKTGRKSGKSRRHEVRTLLIRKMIGDLQQNGGRAQISISEKMKKDKAHRFIYR